MVGQWVGEGWGGFWRKGCGRDGVLGKGKGREGQDEGGGRIWSGLRVIGCVLLSFIIFTSCPSENFWVWVMVWWEGVLASGEWGVGGRPPQPRLVNRAVQGMCHHSVKGMEEGWKKKSLSFPLISSPPPSPSSQFPTIVYFFLGSRDTPHFPWISFSSG